MRGARLRQCAILVGGLGTRLGALTQDTPKPLLEIGDRPFLAWLMRELCRYGVEEVVLLTGHLSERVRTQAEALAARLPRKMDIRIAEEPFRAGTGGALHHARHLLDERFLLCNGDSLFDTNLARLLADSAADGVDVLGRLTLRRLPDAGRFGVVELDGDRVVAFRERPDAALPAIINAGIYVISQGLIDHCAPECSLERDVMPKLAAAGALRGTLGEGYFRDIGIPEDLEAGRAEIPARLHRPALFLDRDGVLNHDHGWVGTRERFEWTDGAREAVAYATARGMHVFVVTNQSGVARGHYDEDAVRELHGWIDGEMIRAGGTIDDFRYCPYHPEAALEPYRQASDWRKPAPGMILDLIRAWELNPARCLLVGDNQTDIAAAEAAGVAGHLFSGGNLLACVAPLVDDLLNRAQRDDLLERAQREDLQRRAQRDGGALGTTTVR